MVYSKSDKQTGIFMATGRYILFPIEKSIWETEVRSEVSLLRITCKYHVYSHRFRPTKRNTTFIVAPSRTLTNGYSLLPFFSFNHVAAISPHVAINQITAYLILIIVQQCLPNEVLRNTLVSSKFLKLLLGKIFTHSYNLSHVRLTLINFPSNQECFRACFLILGVVLRLGPAAPAQATFHLRPITK